MTESLKTGKTKASSSAYTTFSFKELGGIGGSSLRFTIREGFFYISNVLPVHEMSAVLLGQKPLVRIEVEPQQNPPLVLFFFFLPFRPYELERVERLR